MNTFLESFLVSANTFQRKGERFAKMSTIFITEEVRKVTIELMDNKGKCLSTTKVIFSQSSIHVDLQRTHQLKFYSFTFAIGRGKHQ